MNRNKLTIIQEREKLELVANNISDILFKNAIPFSENETSIPRYLKTIRKKKNDVHPKNTYHVKGEIFGDTIVEVFVVRYCEDCND